MSGFSRRHFTVRSVALPLLIIAIFVALIATAYVYDHRGTTDPAARDAASARSLQEFEAAQAADTAERQNVKVTRPTGRPLRVLFTGDSLTYGLYASRQELGYRGVMVAALQKQGPTEAASSERSGAGTGVVASIVDVPANLDLAIIELGTNDVGAKTPIPEFTTTYGALLDKIRAKSPGVPLLCVGTWNKSGGGYGPDLYNNVIQQQCEKRSGKTVSMYGLFSNDANRGPAGQPKFGGISDNFHPNDTGYAAIADTLLKRVTFT